MGVARPSSPPAPLLFWEGEPGMLLLLLAGLGWGNTEDEADMYEPCGGRPLAWRFGVVRGGGIMGAGTGERLAARDIPVELPLPTRRTKRERMR